MEKMTLYEIDQAIMECLDMETGEILDFERLNELNMAREQKIENVALYIKTLTAQADAIKAEENALAERRKAKENRVKGLKNWLAEALDGQAFETAKVRLGFRKSEGVEVKDLMECCIWLEKNGHFDCVKYSTPDVNKTELKKLLKAGAEIPGAVLEERVNLQMK